ncbi:MAG TPA: hypothetical protein VKI65_07955, partial [Gemmataceae bacterium]|nr:hypothetical protein [Gemmataceae bacterium]
MTNLGRRSFIQQVGATGIALPFAISTSGAAESAAPKVQDVGLASQLFLDDRVVESMQRLQRKLHRPKKTGLIQEADGSPWQRGDQISVLRDRAGRFHMVYRFIWEDPSVRDLHPSIGEDRAHWFRETTGYATSADGIRWMKPVLGLVEGPTGFRRAAKAKWKDGVFWEPAGMSKKNNLGCPIAVIQDVGEFGGISDPKRRYLINTMRKADTHAFAELVDAGLYFAADVPDLLTDRQWRQKLEMIWEGRRRGPRGPAVHVAGFDSSEKVWFVCVQGSFGLWRKRGGRDIARWISRDLKEWSKEELVLPIAKDESRRSDNFVEYMDIRVIRIADIWLGQ